MDQQPWIRETLLTGSSTSTTPLSDDARMMILAVHLRERQIVKDFWANARKALRQRNDELAIKNAPYYDLDSESWD